MTFKELKAAVKGRFMNWGKYTAEKLENVSAIFEGTTTEDAGKVLTVGEDGSPEWGEGGGGLPPYTSADKGKFLGLGEGSSSTTEVIVPEQSVTLVGESPDPAPLTNADDFANLAAGTNCILRVNGVDYEVEVIEDSGVKYVDYDNYTYTISYAPDGPYAGVSFGASDGTYVVSLSASVPSVVPKWDYVIPIRYLIGGDVNDGFQVFDISNYPNVVPVKLGDLYQKYVPVAIANTGDVCFPISSTSVIGGQIYYNIAFGFTKVNYTSNIMTVTNLLFQSTSLDTVIDVISATEHLFTLTPSV